MNIIYLAPIAYDALKQRPQYIAEELSRKHQVYYIEPTIRLTSCIINGGKAYRGEQRYISRKLSVIRCNGTFVLPFRWNVYDILSLNGISERRQLKSLFDSADVIIVGYEGWMNVISGLKEKKTIYDKMDENALLVEAWQVKKYLIRSERKLLTRISAMIVTAHKFLDDYKNKADRIYLVPNGVKLENMEKTETQKKESGIVYGYIGMISSWFDMEAVKSIAEMDNTKVILAGPCDVGKYEKENIIYTGRIPKKDVAGMIQSFDVCLYPFRQDSLLDTINPVKIYEYLALNKPIIAVDSRETRIFGDLIYRYRSKEELKSLCKAKLKKPFDTEEDCTRFMKENSWENRAQQINKILEEM